MMHVIYFFHIVLYFDNLHLMWAGNDVQDYLTQTEQDDVSKLFGRGNEHVK
jgi:hypothetical protein